jgi:nephrocystin-3
MAAQLKDPGTFRVFFSSPFRGMEEERTELTRKYFPEIHHKCAEMGLQFVPVDMRWGITAESTSQAQTISICLKEIDRSDMLIGFFGQVRLSSSF